MNATPLWARPTVIWRALVVTSLLLFGTFFASQWLQRPQPTVLAQSPQAESAGRIVERWHGTVSADDFGSNTYAPCPWVCPGDFHYSDLQEWYLEVFDDGTVTGYIRTEVVDYSYSQSRTNNLCGPVAETNYTIEGCTYTGQLTQPQSTFMVQGKRELQQYTQKPILRFTAVTVGQECQAVWSARGTHSKTGATVHKQEVADCDRPPYEESFFYIITHDNGQPPQIIIDYSSEFGILTATTEEPLLELDREFLERSIFLDQVPVEESFVAKTNWNSPDGGWLTWQLADTEADRIGPSTAPEIPKPIAVGSQGVGKKQLTVQVQTTLNRTSSPKNTQISVAPPPAWAGAPGQISATKVSGAVAYKSTFKFPEPPFDGNITVWDIVPFLGGKQFGVTKTQGTLSWEAQSTSEGQGSLAGQTGFTIMGKGLTGSLGGRARVVLDESGVKIPEGGIDFGISGTIESEPEPLLKVVPSLRPALILIERISERAANFINERATLKLELSPKMDFGFNFFSENDEIKFKNAEAKPGFGFKTVLELKLIEDVLQATASIGGTIAATFQVPEPYFKEAALQGLIQAQIILYRWAWEGEKAWSVVISGASAAAANAGELWQGAAGSWQPMDRSYMAMENYARWHGDALTAQSTSEVIDKRLVENGSPLASPSLHIWTNTSGQNRLLQTWVHDDPNDPEFSSGEIVYSASNGDATSWQTPVFLTNDGYDDLAPQAVTLTNNQRLFVWQRMDTPTPPDIADEPDNYLSHWQIYAERFGGTRQQLSPGGSLNYRHELAVLSDGALVVWINNPASQLIGDNTNPDDILFARYINVGSSWSITGTALADVAGLLSLDLATNGPHAALVLEVDRDNDLATPGDRELYYLIWNGTAWSAATRLTNNSVADENPQLLLDASGLPILVWRQAGTLKFLQGGWQNTAADLPLPGAAARPDFDLVQSSDGHFALVWQEAGPEDTRIAYAVYDAAHSRWSDQLTMTPPAGAEGSMATSIAAGFLPADEDKEERVNGALVFAYQLAHVQTVTRTVNNVETGSGTVNGVKMPNTVQIGQRDLRVATVPLRTNLSITAGDLSIPAGDKIQAVIHNTGELAVANAPVVLHLGPADPVSGATQTQAQNIPLLAAGSAATVTFTVADPAISLLVVEIDPARTLLESDITDNRATLGTDVAIAPQPNLYSQHGTAVRAQVTQIGPRYISLMAPATLSLNSPTGPVVGTSQFSFPLAPTEPVTVTTFISTSLLGAGRHQLYWTLDPAGTLGETDRANNVAGTTIMILPDLAIVEDTVFFGTAPGSSAPFEFHVQNLGNWPNAATTVEVFDGPPGEAATHSLLSLPLAAIEPGATVAISGTLPLTGLPAATRGLSAIYVQLDPAGTIEESNENNNLVAAGAVLESATNPDGTELFMPSLRRQQDSQVD